MTELREKVRAEISNAIAEVYDAYNPIEKAVDQATDAIMALFAGGAADLTEAARFARTVLANMKAFRDEGDLQAMGDAIQRIDAALTAAYAIDRPAPVVVEDLEWRNGYCPSGSWYGYQADSLLGMYEVGFEDGAWAGLDGHLSWEWEADEDPRHYKYREDDMALLKAACQADYTRRILSAVNAVSEAQVRADERDDVEIDDVLAWAGGVQGCPDEFRHKLTDQEMRIADAIHRAQVEWLRAQEGGE